MKKIESISVKFKNKNNNKRVRFSAYFGKENNSFTQNGSFRSDWDFKQFTNFASFKKAVYKYAENESAYATRVMIDQQVMVFGHNDPTASPVVKSVLDKASN